MYQRVWLKSTLVIISILIIIAKSLLSVNWFELEHEFQIVVKSGRPVCDPDWNYDSPTILRSDPERYGV